jgi:hypothetical protein
LVEKYKTILPTKKIDSDKYAKASDVYLLFPSDAEWKDQPHQVIGCISCGGMDPKNRFDGEAFAQKSKTAITATSH